MSLFDPLPQEFYPQAEIAVSGRAARHLVETGPWTRVVSVVLYAVGGMLAVGSLLALVFQGGLRDVLIALLLGLLAYLYLAPAVCLGRHAGAARQLREALEHGERAGQFVEDALDQMRRFWRLVGLMAAGGLALPAFWMGLTVLDIVSTFFR